MELKTNLINYKDHGEPVNYSKGAMRTVELMQKIKHRVLFGEVWVAECVGGAGYEYLIHISVNSAASVDLFTPLRAFGISDELNFVVDTLTKHLYIPNRTVNIITEMQDKFSDDSIQDRLSGLFEYLMGIVDVAAIDAGCGNFFTEAYTIDSFTSAPTMSRASECFRFGLVKTNTPSALVDNDVYIFDKDESRKLTYLGREAASLSAIGYDATSNDCIVYPTPTATGNSLTVDVLSKMLNIFGNSSIFVPHDSINADTKFYFTTEPRKTPIVLKAVGTPTLQNPAFEAFCKVYNFHVKGTLTDKDLEVVSVKSEYDDDPIAQELYKTVPEFYKDIDLKPYKHIVAGIAKNSIKTAMFFGESGTGKSTIARAMFNVIGLPYAVLNCSVNIEESDIVGTMIPNPKKASADDPEFVWKDGILTTAVRNGYGIVIEEINFARPGVLGLLNSLLDDAHTLYLPNGESVVAHPNFRLIATGNLGYEGTNRLNAALVNRFNIVHTFDVMNEAATMKVIKKRTGFKNDEQLKKLYSAVVVLRKYIKDQNLSGTVSLRQLLNLVQCGKYYARMDEAFVDIVLQGALLEYPEYFDEFKSSVLKSLGLDFRLEVPED